MKSDVFNCSIGTPNGFDFSYPSLSKQQEQTILAELFEQLLIFDRITISTSRLNFALVFLISRIGINSVERLLESGYIKLMIWTPVIVHGTGTQREDNTIDESVIYGQPPIVAASLMEEDRDPERNIKTALSHFNFNKERKKIFTKIALKNYIVPDGMTFSNDSAKLIIDAYKGNNLSNIGLPFEKEPEQLNLDQRQILHELSNKILETAVLAKYGLKSYENYEHYEICKQNLSNIGKAYNISENTSAIFKLENLPNLKALYLSGKLDFDSVFTIRHLSNAKYYRKWINEIGESNNANEITSEYFKEIKGRYRFFETTKGKLLRNLSIFGISTALGTAITGTTGIAASLIPGLLDTFWLDSILKGKNPSIFIDDLKKEISHE